MIGDITLIAIALLVAVIVGLGGAFSLNKARGRIWLMRELGAWVDEGLISEAQAEAVRGRYHLADLPADSTRLLFGAIYTLGALLVGGGVISFVAAHWTGMDTWLKVSLLVAALLASHGTGYYFWKVSRTRPQWGHSLVLLGTFIYGANIGLMAQIFHVHSDFYNGFALWAIGALVVAVATGSTPNAIVALVASFIWFFGALYDKVDFAIFYPTAVVLMGCGFAYFRRSTLLFTLCLAIGAIALPASSAQNAHHPWAVAASGITIGLLYFTAGQVSALKPSWESYAFPLKCLGLLAWDATAYVLSFEEGAREVIRNGFGMTHLLWLWNIGFAGVAAIVLWVHEGPNLFRQKTHRPLTIAGLVATVLLLATFVIPDALFASICANGAALALSVGLIAVGMEAFQRNAFWAGLLYLGLLIVSRFFEYDTGLMVKAAVLVGCGLAVVAGGLVFERRLQHGRTQHA